MVILTMPYCDNIHCLGVEQQQVDQGCDEVCKGLSNLGFRIHEEQPSANVMETLGGVVDGDRGQVRTTSLRMWYLIEAFNYVQKIVVSVEDIQRLLWLLVYSTDQVCQFFGVSTILFLQIVNLGN
jgi:hypothetical protein